MNRLFSYTIVILTLTVVMYICTAMTVIQYVYY